MRERERDCEVHLFHDTPPTSRAGAIELVSYITLIYVCMYVCMCMYIYIYIYIYVYVSYACIYVYIMLLNGYIVC